MYLEYYNLKEWPFNITPDPRFIYWAPQHREAFDHVCYGIRCRKGFIEFTGEVGSGKTTLCRAILAGLGAEVATALVLNSSLSETQLLRSILNDFGIQVGRRDRLDYIEALNDFLLQKNSENVNVALVIDEAQNMTPQVMEQVRQLSNLETDQHKLIQMVLCGQPELQQRLARPDLRQLRQRIAVRYHLTPLDKQDVAAYIDHRLQVAGAAGSVTFSPAAIRKICAHSQGSPRVINTVCDGALLAGYVDKVRTIDTAHVRRAVQEFGG